SWAKASVATAVNKGLLTGYPDNTFRPANKATRAEAVAVTVLALK
ncbi:MAG: S-layer homology domain-containing protein, partial [Syntrophomonadaceae bacterium]|nr:S-layer homology domain-containing protein [Syntrophomonadaceae bacterium]